MRGKQRFLSGVWMTEELVQDLILETREAFSLSYDRFSDDTIMAALDIKDCEPETAAQFLEDPGADLFGVSE